MSSKTKTIILSVLGTILAIFVIFVIIGILTYPGDAAMDARANKTAAATAPTDAPVTGNGRVFNVGGKTINLPLPDGFCSVKDHKDFGASVFQMATTHAEQNSGILVDIAVSCSSLQSVKNFTDIAKIRPYIYFTLLKAVQDVDMNVPSAASIVRENYLKDRGKPPTEPNPAQSQQVLIDDQNSFTLYSRKTYSFEDTIDSNLTYFAFPIHTALNNRAILIFIEAPSPSATITTDLEAWKNFIQQYTAYLQQVNSGIQ